MRLWLHLYECVFMTSLVTSPGHRAGQILTLVYPRQYLSYSVNQKLKMSEMLMAIIWVNSISGMNSGKKILRAQNGGHLKILKYQTASIGPQIWNDCPELCQKLFFMMTASMMSQSVLKVSFYSSVLEFCSGSKLQGRCLVNSCKYGNCLSRLYMPKDDLNW